MRTMRLTVAVLAVAMAVGCDAIDRLRGGERQGGAETGNTTNAQQPQGAGAGGGAPGVQVPSIPGLPSIQGLPGLPSIPGITTGNQANANGPRQTDATALAPGAVDGSGAFTLGFLQAEARSVHAQLVNALQASQRQRVATIPLSVGNDPAVVNAMAGCDRRGTPFMLITQGILVLNAALAESMAIDELAGTQLRDGYTRGMIERIRRELPMAGLSSGSVPAGYALNPQKLARQRFLFDAATAFVLGHELAHHYRGHTGCANVGRPAGQEAEVEDLHQAVSRLAPLFNQPIELEADTWGIVNVLDAGARRTQGKWNDEGATLSLDFFSQIESLGGASPILWFVRSHPPSALRRPVVQLAASQWRNGQRPSENLGLPLPIPIPIMLPQTH